MTSTHPRTGRPVIAFSEQRRTARAAVGGTR